MLPGVTINLKNSQTGATRTTVTNEQGVYSLPALERGIYELSSELTGFAAASRTRRAHRGLDRVAPTSSSASPRSPKR